MEIRRTATTWHIQDRGVSVPVGPVLGDPVDSVNVDTLPVGLVPGEPAPGEPVSESPDPDVQDLPPLRLRKTGSSNWSFLPKVLLTFFKSRLLVKNFIF